tara:strand:+ start:2926 stop:3114 length:189 start_codon:yes stop_codon:yes gene_type:complete
MISRMKVGDLVRYTGTRPLFDVPMLVIKKGVYVGNRDTKVLCSDGNIKMAYSLELEVISESR